MPIRPWASVPRDKNLSDQTNDFLVWVMKSLSEVQGSPTPPPAPTVSVSVSGNAVTLTWNEIAGSAGYIIYENTTAVVPPKPIAVVQSLGSQAVRSGLSNAKRFTGLATGTFYYFVQAITANGVAGAMSTVQKAVVTASGSPPAGAASVNDHFVLWQTDLELINRYVLPFGLVMGEGDGVLPHAIPAGVAGQVLISNGPAVDPSFQDPIVSGATAIGAAPSTNPVFVATWDGTNIRVPLTLNAAPGASDYGLVVRPIPGAAGTVTGTVRIIGNSGAIFDVPQNTAAPANVLVIGGRYDAVLPTLVSGNAAAIQLDVNGRIMLGPSTAVIGGLIANQSVSLNQVGGVTLTGDNTANFVAKVPVLPARANAATQTWTEGNQVPLSTDLAGNLRVLTTSGASISSTRTDTFTAAGNGVTVDVSANPLIMFAIQVTGTGNNALAWDVRLEGSLDNVNFTTILQHTTTTGDKIVAFNGAGLAPTRFFRSRVASLTLGLATNIVVAILGVQ